jgi:hypothetical protein
MIRPLGRPRCLRIRAWRPRWRCVKDRSRPRAERAFSNVEPENRLLARILECLRETKLATLADAEAALKTAKAAKLTLPATHSLRDLAADLPRLWNAQTASPRDRKRLLRTLIADVTLLPEPNSDTVRIGVRWQTGATDELTVARPGPGRTLAAASELVRRHPYQRPTRGDASTPPS